MAAACHPMEWKESISQQSSSSHYNPPTTQRLVIGIASGTHVKVDATRYAAEQTLMTLGQFAFGGALANVITPHSSYAATVASSTISSSDTSSTPAAVVPSLPPSTITIAPVSYGWYIDTRSSSANNGSSGNGGHRSKSSHSSSTRSNMVDIIPFAARSGVNEQPVGDEETLRGATNRLNALCDHFRSPSYTGQV
jgi:hypothetical protein